MNRPEPLANALRVALAGLRLDKRLQESRAMALWPDIVGDTIAAKTRPLHITRGTLMVRVTSSVWAHQLTLLKPTLLARLEERIGPGVIRDLRWRTGALDQVDEDTPALTYVRRIPKRVPDAAPLSAEETAAIASLAGHVEDPTLAAGLARVLEARARRAHRLAAAGWVPCVRCGCLHDASPDVGAHPALGARLCPVCRLDLKAWVDGPPRA